MQGDQGSGNAGVVLHDADKGLGRNKSDEDAEALARRLAAGREWHGVTGALVSRKVTIGPWTGPAQVAES